MLHSRFFFHSGHYFGCVCYFLSWFLVAHYLYLFSSPCNFHLYSFFSRFLKISLFWEVFTSSENFFQLPTILKADKWSVREDCTDRPIFPAACLVLDLASAEFTQFSRKQPKILSLLNDWKRAFWACCCENWVYKFGHWTVVRNLWTRGPCPIHLFPPPVFSSLVPHISLSLLSLCVAMPNSQTHDFIEVSGHNLESSQMWCFSVYNVFITNQFQTTFAQGGRE